MKYLRLIWLRQTAQTYMRMRYIQQTAVCHAMQQWHTLQCHAAHAGQQQPGWAQRAGLPETNGAKWAVTSQAFTRWRHQREAELIWWIALLLIYRPRKDKTLKGWVGLVGWPVARAWSVPVRAPVLRTGTSEKSLRQYRHFCHGWKYAGTHRHWLVSWPYRPTILWKSERDSFAFQRNCKQCMYQQSKVQRL